MSDPLFDGDDDANTPLPAEEREALIPAHITLRRELNEVEQIGIADADRWAFARRRDVLDEAFLKSLHRRMFGAVWKWAGLYRTTGRNIDSTRVYVACRCDCGTARHVVRLHAIRHGETLSCGCLSAELSSLRSLDRHQRGSARVNALRAAARRMRDEGALFTEIGKSLGVHADHACRLARQPARSGPGIAKCGTLGGR